MIRYHNTNKTIRQWHPLLKVLLVMILMGATASSNAQASDEHASHHKSSQGNLSVIPSVAGQTPGKDMMGAMGEMMKQMGMPKRKALYPSLMSLPDIPLERRSEIQQLAQERMQSGLSLMAKGIDTLLKASAKTNFSQMQDAVASIREGLSQYDSGLAASRALAEGKVPRQVALLWFKQEMNLLPLAPATHTLLGGPLFHLTIIALFLVFFIIMIWMYFFKMRRASALLESLASKGDVSATSPISPPPASASEVIEETHPSSGGLAPPAKPPKFPVMRTLTIPLDQWEGQLRVCRIFDETPGVKTYWLASLKEVALPFTYFPGQFITITATINGTRAKRSYTIASTPTQLHYCAITVKREEQGLFSRYLHDEVKEGDVLEVMGPNGKFTFTGEEASSIVLICGGVGITPMMGIIRYLTDIGWHGDIYLLYCCRTTSDFIFRDELERLQKRYPNLNVFATMLRASGTVWMGLKGEFTTSIISYLVPDVAKRRIHVCGPPGMMNAVLNSLKELSVSEKQIYTEAFGTAMKPPLTPQQMEAIAPENKAVVLFTRSHKTAPILPNYTLLEIAEANGVSIDNSCRTGQCGLCKVKLLTGKVSMDCDDALSEEEKQHGFILACQAKTDENIEVDV
ncbi:oxidoreductase [Legionella sp. PC1000]|uniref:2Fe-2S iron-sulfur cluster-binding protein n=1 Tax=Legionella sp. PC1000 TaxID=2746060 RepID=UPI0015FA018E|nr:2Fe-2S iron-sulfur cluster-binding protein [Legionella sp. PC1000]QLZ68010.1 oxidoreductase [Legionella sp. PC1000]